MVTVEHIQYDIIGKVTSYDCQIVQTQEHVAHGVAEGGLVVRLSIKLYDGRQGKVACIAHECLQHAGCSLQGPVAATGSLLGRAPR